VYVLPARKASVKKICGGMIPNPKGALIKTYLQPT